MQNRRLFIVLAVFFAIFSGTGWAINNPVGSPTVPQSSFRSGLIRSANPVDTSSNLVVTGNVGGGRHFRGVVPYRSSWAFGADLGSSSLDSFLRNSFDSRNVGRSLGMYEPYYSPSGTVTTTKPGQSGVVSAPTMRTGSGVVSGISLPALKREQSLYDQDAIVEYLRARPMSLTREETERLFSDRVAEYVQGRRLTDEQEQSDLMWVSGNLVESRENLPGQDTSLWLPVQGQLDGDVQQQFEAQMQAEQTGEYEQFDIYERMKQEVDDLQKAIWQYSAAQEGEEDADGQPESSEKSSQGTSSFLEEVSNLGKLSDAQLSTKAKAVLGEHKTFASFSNDKFNQYLRAAEYYLKQGKYYRAADAYTLALIYKRDDPLAYAGKSHALFAAGEYMSSALFLARALEIFPEYALFKIHLVSMVGDRDKLESRTADVEQWIERNDAAELHFLLAYVYYQMDRLIRAKEEIELAYEKMPDSPAVVTLKKAIDNAAKLGG